MFKVLLNKKLKAQEDLLNLAISENRAMTEDEQARNAVLETEIKDLENSIELQAKIEARKIVDATPANTIIPAEPKNADEKVWKNGLGEFLVAVKNASTGEGTDNRLFKNAATGANEGIGSEGGFLVQTDFVSSLMQKTYEVSQVASRTLLQPIGPAANGVKMNAVDEDSRAKGSRYGGIRAYWASEAGTAAQSNPKFKKLELELDKLLAFCYATNELLTDYVALESWIRMAFADEMSFVIDDAFFAGTGVGQPLGILNSPALVSVAKESGQAAGTITYENVSKMWSRMWARSRQNAVWFINQDCEPQLNKMVLAVGSNGIPVYMPAGGVSGQPYSTLFGRPVIPIEQCETAGTKGDIVLADMSQYMRIEKGGIQAASSLHVRFLYDENVFRFTHRINGMPLWNAPLTPYKGTNTLSPFVALATR